MVTIRDTEPVEVAHIKTKQMKPEKNTYNLTRMGSLISAILFLTIISFSQAFSQAALKQPETFRICTFNIQNFGKTKLNDTARVHVLAGIIRKYGIVAVQEVSDVTGVLPGAFRDIVNQKGKKTYAVTCSELTGNQPDDKTSQERYAFYYDTTMFSLLARPVLYNDSVHDYFAREPYMAWFRSKKGNFTFVLITIHTTPEKAVAEIGSLDEVVKWARNKYAGETEMIVMGDFNASCSYANPGELDKLAIRGSNYYWVVPDSAKTNLSVKSNCAYDRYVLTLPAKSYYTGHWGVDKSYTSKTISDHWPVWAEFKVAK
jgi:endonuclease/exonuclease/phosphatase family metal-dependent hydrolase